MIDVTIQFKEDELRQAYCMLTGKIASDDELKQLFTADLTTNLTTPERATFLMIIVTRIVEINKPRRVKHSFHQNIDELRKAK